MPTYQVQCDQCQTARDVRLTFAAYDQVRAGQTHMTCATCGSEEHLCFSPSDVAFVMKDGESGGWQTKALKENKYRAKRSTLMGKRQRDNVFTPTLQPNYKGQETGSWREAQYLASRDSTPDKSAQAAQSYDALVSKEKTGS